MNIGVSMRVVNNSSYPEVRDAVSHDWIRMLDTLGVTPVLVPNVLQDPWEYLQAVGARGLILTGGGDLGPLPGEPGGEPSPNERDRTENSLLEGAVDSALPVFGVCRGLQLINVFFGGGLVRDLGPVEQHVNVLHPVEIVSTPWQTIKGFKHLITNSYHDQGVVLSGLAPDLKPFAVAHGDVVEALYHPALPVLAVQWHPERQNPACELDRALLLDWLARCG